MLSRWRSKCFFNRPAKQIQALIYGSWFNTEPARPLLEGHSFVVVREYYYVTMSIFRNGLCRKSFFNRPSIVESMLQSLWGYPYPIRPIFQAHNFTVKRKQSGLSSIVLLFFSCAPLAVAWLISCIVVYSVNGVLRAWLRPHVSEEVQKGCSPPQADFDASSAVSVIASGIWIVASRLHHLPRLVLGGLFTGMPASFRLLACWLRITSSHLTFPENDWVVRAEPVHNNRLGSFHYCAHGKAVQ